MLKIISKKKTIKILYNRACDNLKSEWSGEDNAFNEIPTFDDVGLGKKDNKNKLITYNYIWTNNTCDSGYKNNVTLCVSGGYINGYYKGKKSVVTSVKFAYKEAYTPKHKICWYVDNKSDVKCKNFDGVKVPVDEETSEWVTYITSAGTLNESIIVGDYISKEQADKDGVEVNYYVNYFPVAYKLLTHANYKKKPRNV